ncbi:MAG: hypothetical protein IAF38_20125 [Bacteroidia bacterium]|nr:hypothetical protein [Bacteroidia bacterium]
MGTIYAAISIFGLVAISGMYLFSLIMRNKQMPKAVTLIHGLFGGLGIVLLIVYCFNNKTGPVVSIIVFAVAAFAGVMLNYRDITGKKVPKWLAMLHGLVAVIGFAFLLVFALC